MRGDRHEKEQVWRNMEGEIFKETTLNGERWGSGVGTLHSGNFLESMRVTLVGLLKMQKMNLTGNLL